MGPNEPKGGLFDTLLARVGGAPAPPTLAAGMWAKSTPPKQEAPPPQPQPPAAAPPPPVGGAAGLPVVPPNPQGSLPPAERRWMNGQQIQQAYANNWQPNPVLLRAMLGK